MESLTMYNLDEWEKEAKAHVESEAFAKPLLDAIGEIRRLGRENGELAGERFRAQDERAGMMDIVLDPAYSDRSVRLLLVHRDGENGHGIDYCTGKRMRDGG